MKVYLEKGKRAQYFRKKGLIITRKENSIQKKNSEWEDIEEEIVAARFESSRSYVSDHHYRLAALINQSHHQCNRLALALVSHEFPCNLSLWENKTVAARFESSRNYISDHYYRKAEFPPNPAWYPSFSTLWTEASVETKVLKPRLQKQTSSVRQYFGESVTDYHITDTKQ